MTALYTSRMNAKIWYGNSVTVPLITSRHFFNFVTSCVGIVNTLVEKKLDRQIKIAVSDSIDTAYADQHSWRIVVSNKFFSGDFSGIGATGPLNNIETVGAILGILVHEIGHFAYSPDTLMPFVDAVEKNTQRDFSPTMARDLGNILEDIYIENRIARLFPSLSWSMEAYNRYIVSQERYIVSQTDLRAVDAIVNFGQTQQIMNYLLYAKVTARSGKVSSLVSGLFNLARSVVNMDDLQDRIDLCVKLYDLLYPVSMSKDQPDQSSSQQSQDQDSDDQDQSDDTQDQDSDQNDGSQDNDQDPTDDDQDSDQDSGSTDDNDQDQDSGSTSQSDDDQSDDADQAAQDQDSGNGSTDDDQDTDTDTDTNDQDSGSTSTDDTDNDQDSDQYGDGRSYDDHNIDRPKFGYGSDIDQPTVGQVQDIDLNKTQSVTDDDIITEYEMELGSEMSLDSRYIGLSQIARQRATKLQSVGSPKNRGRQFGDLQRIVRDGKVFRDPIQQDIFEPMQVIFVLDCSYSMTNNMHYACKMVLGCATALMNGKCKVQVYGHTANTGMDSGISIFPLLRLGESLAVLSQRLQRLTYEIRKYRATKFYNAKDGYVLDYLSGKFSGKNTKRLFIVISDGEPQAPNYEKSKARAHTQEIVSRLRLSGIHSVCLSIDLSASLPNQAIYGIDNEICSTDHDALDKLILAIVNGERSFN